MASCAGSARRGKKYCFMKRDYPVAPGAIARSSPVIRQPTCMAVDVLSCVCLYIGCMYHHSLLALILLRSGVLRSEAERQARSRTTPVGTCDCRLRAVACCHDCVCRWGPLYLRLLFGVVFGSLMTYDLR